MISVVCVWYMYLVWVYSMCVYDECRTYVYILLVIEPNLGFYALHLSHVSSHDSSMSWIFDLKFLLADYREESAENVVYVLSVSGMCAVYVCVYGMYMPCACVCVSCVPVTMCGSPGSPVCPHRLDVSSQFWERLCVMRSPCVSSMTPSPPAQ